MLVDVLDACKGESPAWKDLAVRDDARATRYAAVQERLIAADGSFPPIGRSIAYRFGSFHLSEKTVRNHASNLFDTLGVWSRAQAIVFARERGYGS